ncbi:MAG: CoA ester lyase [Rhodospirillum sp.]|nr:CoA ester lyase [Rhodospirillum sp.]
MTALFVPGDRPERIAKAVDCGADLVIVDLEDAVGPGHKARARRCLSSLQHDVVVRINGVETEWHGDDLAALDSPRILGVMLPKAESDASVAALSSRVARPVIALVETARGLAAVDDIAGAAARLAFGSVDFSTDLGCSHKDDALLLARTRLVLAARVAGGPPPIDGVTLAINDPDAVGGDARRALDLGFGGKLCVHPRQVAWVREAFAPTAEERNWANQVLATGQGVARVEGEMVDKPVRERARRILARGCPPG